MARPRRRWSISCSSGQMKRAAPRCGQSVRSGSGRDQTAPRGVSRRVAGQSGETGGHRAGVGPAVPSVRNASRSLGDALTVADWSRVGIVVELTAEARLVQRAWRACCHRRRYRGRGATRSGAAGRVRRQRAGQHRVGGGLDPSMRPGHVLVPEAVTPPGQSFVTDNECG